MVLDAHTIYAIYKAFCAAQHGIDNPPVVVLDAAS
jgi:hypothetical protein